MTRDDERYAGMRELRWAIAGLMVTGVIVAALLWCGR